MYLYEGHLGSLYLCDEFLDYDDLCCEQCGDSDRFLGSISSWQDIVDAIGRDEIEVEPGEGGWDLNYIFSLCRKMDVRLDRDEFKKYCEED